MQNFTDMHGRTICDGAEIYYNGEFPNEIPTEKRIREGVAIIDGNKLVFAVTINNQLQGIGLYWRFDNEPCYDLLVEHRGDIRLRIDAIAKTLCDIDNRLVKAININPNEKYIKQILPRHEFAMATLCEIEDLYFEDCLTFGEVEELALQAGALAVDITILEIILEKENSLCCQEN